MAWPMAAVLPDDATVQGKHLHLSYREWLGFRGHEFHYSSIVGNPTPYYIYQNLRASYVHLYWGDKNIMDLWKDFTP
jgi:cobyrinic acid a,c-diamide synthase